MNRAEEIRKEILLQVYAVRPLGLLIDRLERDARKQGYDYTQREIERELQFLVDENLLFELQARGTTRKFYRISPVGVRQYEQKFQS